MKQTDSLTSVFTAEITSPAAGIQVPMMEHMESRQLMSVTLDTSTLSITDGTSTARPAESLSLNYSKIDFGYKLTLNYKRL